MIEGKRFWVVRNIICFSCSARTEIVSSRARPNDYITLRVTRLHRKTVAKPVRNLCTCTVMPQLDDPTHVTETPLFFLTTELLRTPHGLTERRIARDGYPGSCGYRTSHHDPLARTARAVTYNFHQPTWTD